MAADSLSGSKILELASAPFIEDFFWFSGMNFDLQA
jgi:hypothetical protein